MRWKYKLLDTLKRLQADVNALTSKPAAAEQVLKWRGRRAGA